MRNKELKDKHEFEDMEHIPGVWYSYTVNVAGFSIPTWKSSLIRNPTQRKLSAGTYLKGTWIKEL